MPTGLAMSMSARRTKLPESCWKLASLHVLGANPKEPGEIQSCSRSCAKAVQKVLQELRFGPNLANAGHMWPRCLTLGKTRPEFGHFGGQATVSSRLAKIGRTYARAARRPSAPDASKASGRD